MGEKKVQRDGRRKEVMAILDMLEWILRRLRELAAGD